MAAKRKTAPKKREKSTTGKIDSKANKEEVWSHYESYSGYNMHLRVWLILFGVGVPGAIIANPKLQTAVSDSCIGMWMAIAFFLGTLIQIGVAFINKYVNWYTYYYLENSTPPEDQLPSYVWVHDKIGIDFWCDITSITLFTAGVIMLLIIWF